MAARTTAALRQVIRSAALAETSAATDGELLSRFAEGDEGAFAAVVARHTGMVLGVCRRLLPTVQDAEDACQATFVVLARKASSGRWQASVANWLYATARHVAAKARLAAARRGQRERKAAVPEAVEPIDRLTGRELLAALDEELDRLAPTYREALVLCYLEGLTRDEAAGRLGVPAGTVKIRLERGRKRLGDALSGRGWAPGVALLALASTSPAGAPPPRLVQGVLAAVRGNPPAAVAALAKGVAVNGLVNKAVLLLVVVIGVVALGVGAATLGAGGQKPDREPAPPAAKKSDTPDAKAKPDDAPTPTYAGRVLGPDGKPVADARLHVLYYTPKVLPIPQRGASDKDGGFRFSVERKEFDRSIAARPWDEACVVAIADGYGLGVPDFETGKWPPRDGWTVRLVKDDVPITGRIIDLQGKPVAGATVTIHNLYWPMKGNDLAAWHAQLKESKEGYAAIRNHLTGLHGLWMGRDVGRIFPPAVTDAEGRFRLKGVGRERVVALRIDGPTIVSTELWAMTRPGDKVRASQWRRGQGGEDMTFFGADFEHIIPPCRPVVGVVRDKDTGKPIPGAVVQSYLFAGANVVDQTRLRAVADKDGRYRLLGMPKGEGNQIRIAPPDDQPYLMALANVPDAPGLEPVTVDVTLKRGVWITGKVTDKVTGQPVMSLIQYAVPGDNPNLREAPGLTFEHNLWTTPEGTFRIVGLPGRGVVAANGQGQQYLTRVGADRIKGFERLFFNPEGHTVAEVNPEKGAESVTCDLALDPGRTLTGNVVGPDGKPQDGVLMSGLQGGYGGWEHQPAKSAEFKVLALKPGESRLIQFTHPEKKLAGSVVIGGDDKEPLTVKLGPAGVLTGRFVGTDGKPLADLDLFSMTQGPMADPRERPKQDVTAGSFPRGLRTDKDGKFRIEGLAPGLTYRLALFRGMYLLQPDGDVGKGVTVKAGETKDLGEVKIKPFDE